MKNILVTGGSKGLGLEICKKLIDSGNYVFATSRTVTSELEKLLKENPNQIRHLCFDLVEVENIKEELFRKFIPLTSSIDGYVNNAAMAYDDIITNAKLEPLERMFKINVIAPFLITKYVIRNMLFNNKGGSIIHISSISVHTGYKGLSMYASTKGALEAFSKNTAREWGSKKIRSNSLVAGFMETSMSSTLSKEQKSRIYKRTSLKVATSLDSVSSTVEFLLSDDSSSITGQNIFVDSGTI